MAKTRRSRLVNVLGSVAIVVILIAIALSFIDGVVTRSAQKEAALWSTRLDRKIEVGSVSTTFFSGLGVQISAVSVGPGQGEEEALLKLGQASIKVQALRAIFSLGKDIEVRKAELAGLDVNLVRYPDGTTNLERLQKRLAQVEAENPKSPKKQEQPGEKTDLSGIRVDRAALSSARIAFVDRSGANAKTLAITDIALAINDLRAGAPLKVSLKAAVLADQQNLDVELLAAPLPKTLVPTPVSLTLRIKPAIDLAPLAPFLPRSAGLEGGMLDADLSAELGAAVPGGSGKSTIKGVLHALGLRFVEAGNGRRAGSAVAVRPFDIVLDLDVSGDADKGDVAFNKLRLDLGPAGISGTGSVSGLKTSAMKVDGLQLKSHDFDLSKLADFYPPLRKSLGGEISGPIGLSVDAAGTQAAPQLEAKIDLTPVKLALPETLDKAAGAPMTLLLRLSGAGPGSSRFELKADLSGVDLRPGGSLDKAPGDRLDLGLSGLRKASGDKQHIEIADLGLHIKGDEVTGQLTADLDSAAETKSFELSLHSARLDLDKLLIEGKTAKKKQQKPPPDPKSFAGLSGRVEVKLDTLLYKRQTMKNAVVVAKLDQDKLTLEQAGLEAFSGSISAAGTTIELAHPHAPFHALAQLKGIEMAQATAVATDHKVISGKLDAGVDLSGAGDEAEAIKRSLTGNLNGHLIDGVFYGRDLIASATGPLAKSLPFGLAGKEGQGGETSLGKDLPVSLTFANGEAKLGKPLELKTPEADVSLSGGISLAGQLEMPATLLLQPVTINRLTDGKASVSQPVPVKLRLVGPVTAPQVTDLDLKDAAASIVRGAAAGAIGKLFGGSGQGDAEQQARAAAQKQEDAAKKAAADAAKKAAQDAAGQLKGLFGN